MVKIHVHSNQEQPLATNFQTIQLNSNKTFKESKCIFQIENILNEIHSLIFSRHLFPTNSLHKKWLICILYPESFLANAGTLIKLCKVMYFFNINFQPTVNCGYDKQDYLHLSKRKAIRNRIIPDAVVVDSTLAVVVNSVVSQLCPVYRGGHSHL